MKREKKNFIDYLKAFAIILVVTHHAIEYANMHIDNDFLQIFLNLITCVHIQLFFCIAGYLCHEQDIMPYIKKKICRIFIPFLFFTSLKIVYSIFISQEFAHGTLISQVLMEAFIFGKLYWFAYAILLLYVLAPLFWKSRKVNIIILLCLVGINILVGHPSIHVFQIGRTFANACFFLMGILIQQYEEHFIFFKKNSEVIISVCVVVLIIIVTLLNRTQLEITFLLKFILALVQMYILYYIAKNMPSNIKVLKIIGKYSLQIMFFDSFFKVVLFSIANRFFQINEVVMSIIIVVNITLSCVACMIIEKIPGFKKIFGL